MLYCVLNVLIFFIRSDSMKTPAPLTGNNVKQTKRASDSNEKQLKRELEKQELYEKAPVMEKLGATGNQ